MDLDLTCSQILANAGINWDVEWSLAEESYYLTVNGYIIPGADAWDEWDSDTGTYLYEYLTPPSLRCLNGVSDYFLTFYHWSSVIAHQEDGFFSDYGPDSSVFLKFKADGTFEAGTNFLVVTGTPELTFREFMEAVEAVSHKSATPVEDCDKAFPGMDNSVWDEGYYEELVENGGNFEGFCQSVLECLNELPDIVDNSGKDPNEIMQGIKFLTENPYPVTVRLNKEIAVRGLDPIHIHNGATKAVYSHNELRDPARVADTVRQVARILNSNPTYNELVECYYGTREDDKPKDPRGFGEDTLKLLFS